MLQKTQLVDTYGNPFEIPDYTISDIHKAIPKHCFERSGATGLYYVARDVTSLAVTFYLFHRFLTPENVPSAPLRAGLWFVYSFVQGLFGTGLWVLAHECGHQSFSPSKVLNDTVGFLCHSSLLVPYFSWKISHGKHHKATGHMERDMVFVPATKEEYASRGGWLLHQLDELTEETPIATAWHLITQQLFGWPMYLFTNVTGHNKHEVQREGRGVGKHNGVAGGVNHFDPASPLYEAKDAKLILLSDLGLLGVGSILFWVGKNYGLANLLVWYFAPYLWVNHWLGKCCGNLVCALLGWLTCNQWPSRTCNIPILLCPTTLRPLGRILEGRPPRLIENLDSSVDSCSMESSKPTFFITMSAPSHSITPTKRVKPSSQSWAVIIAVTPRMARWDSSRVCGNQ